MKEKKYKSKTKSIVYTSKKSKKIQESNIMSVSLIKKLVFNIKTDTSKLKSYLKTLSLLNTKSKILLQISTINSLIKEITINIDKLKQQKKNLTDSIANGTFFNWKKFIETIIRKASRKNYITKKDREALYDFANVLQSPAYCNPYDYDAYLRWIIYSIDEKIEITSYISKELKLQKNKLEKGEIRVKRKQELIKKAMREIRFKKLLRFIKETKSLILKIRQITKRGKLSAKDIDRISDLVNNVLFNSQI